MHNHDSFKAGIKAFPLLLKMISVFSNIFPKRPEFQYIDIVSPIKLQQTRAALSKKLTVAMVAFSNHKKKKKKM